VQLAEAGGVGGLGLFEVAHRAFAQEEAEHGADRAAGDRQARGFGRPRGCRSISRLVIASRRS
jgi:hypothetical protein